MKRISAIDPSLSNSAFAMIEEHPGIEGFLKVRTRHIERVEIGTYTEIIREFDAFSDGPIDCGFVEDFSNTVGGKWDKNAIMTVNRSGGMAEEAFYAAGIPIHPLGFRQWRFEALGKAPQTPQRSGRMVSYWTKGDKSSKIPDNITPALLRLFDPYLKFSEKANYSQLVYGRLKNKYNEVHTFEEALKFIELAGPVTSRRIQIVFGISIDELEAAGIALAGLKLIKSGKIKL